MQVIDQLENMDRGHYAGPVGWIDAHGDGEWGIALRCGEIANDGHSVRVFAGGGIVADSNPLREFEETEAKFLPMRSALGAID
jgi:menaquinone-specific isochorismate synthase